ncbi:hypothetical protein ACFQ3S_02850 [Mucilaginibacter terrae]|uniref:hypothetical protein n=1 Tax=Mucilaginibacter terrae TaxID=1955052 RepID=UPI00363ABA0B
MIQKTLQTLTGKLQVSIPTTLHELQLGQLMAMQAADKLDDLQAIHILSGVPLHDLQQVKSFAELQVFNDQVLMLAQEIKELYNSEAIPQTVTFSIDGKPQKVKVMKNLSVEPAGAFMASRDIIAEEISKHIALHGDENWQQNFNPSLQTCSQVLAHYFYSKVTGKPYDEELAAEFTGEVERLPVTDVLPIARYFFLNYPNLSRPKTGFWHRLFRRWNSGRALKILDRFGTLTR